MTLRRRAERVQVAGFRFAGVRCGLKARGPDVALVASDVPAVAAGMFTTNRVVAAPVRVARHRITSGQVAAVLVNAGHANACTGRDGVATAQKATALAAGLLGVPARAVLPCSTGRIGVAPPLEKLLVGVRRAAGALSPTGFASAAEAILTTDTFPKTAVRTVRLGARRITVAVLAKGAGMIAPDMATLLAFVMTDAALDRAAADRTLAEAVGATLNGVSVDGHCSPNDAVLLLANGAAANPPVAAGGALHARFTAAVTDALDEIARLVVLDGEGTGRLVEVVVVGARSTDDARRIARAVGESSLCKAAFHRADPNWGRFLSAAGHADARIEVERAEIVVGGVPVFRHGQPLPGTLANASRRMRAREVRLELRLGLGPGEARLLTSDLAPAYLRLDAALAT